MSRKPRFSNSDLERITAAVAAAEGGTSGEIVPVFVESSDHYAEAPWRAAFLFGIGGFLTDFLLAARNGAESWWQPLLVFSGCACAGFFLTQLSPPLLRLLAPKERMREHVALRAEAAFTREQVFLTRERTGILIFISFLERQVRVIADAGIHAKVAEGTWESVVERVVQGMKAGRPADGIVEAIGLCGELLRQHGFAVRPDDTNELPNTLRIE